jgi:osmoprotectant transport system substrate-binding protein
MFATKFKRAIIGVVAAGAMLSLAACSSGGGAFGGSSASASSGASGKTIVVGSANFAEDEILAYIYTQALEAKGIKASTKPNIGSRDVYLAALKQGSIDLVPEYSGNLLQYYDAKATAQSPTDVFAALQKAVPAGFEVLTQSPAQDKDSYNVTKAFSQKYNVTSLSQLASVPGALKIAGAPELATRPYGPDGLKSVYGVQNATVVPFSDGGGALTQAALANGQVQLADIYTTTPGISNFVTLKDPKNLIIAQNIVPLINSKVATSAVKSVLNKVSAALTTAELVKLNNLNQGSQKEQPAAVAKQFLKQHHLD